MAERFERHMSDEDALMWNIEKDPTLRSTILAVGIFDGVPDWQVLRRRVERTSRIIPRFRQRVLSPPLRIGPPRWTVEPTFDLDFHLKRIRLANGGFRSPPFGAVGHNGNPKFCPAPAPLGVPLLPGSARPGRGGAPPADG